MPIGATIANLNAVRPITQLPTDSISANRSRHMLGGRKIRCGAA